MLSLKALSFSFRLRLPALERAVPHIATRYAAFLPRLALNVLGEIGANVGEQYAALLPEALQWWLSTDLSRKFGVIRTGATSSCCGRG
jgi:hypothetical protein